jgi:phage shock protein A
MDNFQDKIRQEIEKLEKEMNIFGRLAEIDESTSRLYDKLRHKYNEIKKLEQELLKAVKRGNLPEIERELNKRKGELEGEADKIREEIKKLCGERQSVLKQQ